MFINYAKESKEILESKGILSTITIIFIISMAPILSFADHSEIIISPAAGSGSPGCENTADRCYIPYVTSVEVGSVVTFSNTDTAAHTFTSGISGYFGETESLGPDGEFDTGLVMSGNSFSHTFNKEGTFNYFCIVHPWMTGIILVDENYHSEQKYSDIQLFLDKESYTNGDTIKVSGIVSNNLGIDMSLVVTKPGGKVVSLEQFAINSDKTFETQIKIGKTFDVDGVYSIKVQYGSENADLAAFEFYQLIQDTIPPLLLVPSDMLVETSDPKGAQVKYSVKAIDDVDGVLQSFCNPSSNSMFQIGKTTVTCKSLDSSGNNAEKSFAITVQLDSQSTLIPDWVKEVAAFWCSDSINDESYVEAVQYLIENNVVTVPANQGNTAGVKNIPNWIKNNACWWSENLISDDDFSTGLEYLIKQGIIQV